MGAGSWTKRHLAVQYTVQYHPAYPELETLLVIGYPRNYNSDGWPLGKMGNRDHALYFIRRQGRAERASHENIR